MEIKLLPLKGPDSYWALQSYIKLLFGLKMLPMYMSKTLEEFFDHVEAMPVEDRQKIVHQAVLMVTLDPGELSSLLKFAADKNGVRFSNENTAALSPSEFMEIIQAVAQAIAALEPNFLSAREKKN
jgi:hypothetical protein